MRRVHNYIEVVGTNHISHTWLLLMCYRWFSTAPMMFPKQFGHVSAAIWYGVRL